MPEKSVATEVNEIQLYYRDTLDNYSCLGQHIITKHTDGPFISIFY